MEKCALSKLVGGKTDDWMRDIFQFCCVGSSDLKGQGSSPVSLLQGASEGNGVSLPWFVLQYNLRWGMYVVHIMSSSLFFFLVGLAKRFQCTIRKLRISPDLPALAVFWFWVKRGSSSGLDLV